MIIAAWILIVILAVVLIALAEAGVLGWATGVALAIGGVLIYLGILSGPGIWLFIKTNPLIVASLLAVYIIGGTVWSVIKWWSFVRKERQRQEEDRKKYRHMEGQRYKIPQASEHKERITTWMTFWPVSLLWTLLDDPIRALFLQIYHSISKKLQAIADREFKGLNVE